MDIQLNPSRLRTLTALALGVLLFSGLSGQPAAAQEQPQEIRDLIRSYEALAMKIRPLQDRVAARSPGTESNPRFEPEGVPLRAQVRTSSSDGAADGGTRAPERLRHRDRAVNAEDEYARVSAGVSELNRSVEAALARIRAPGFGTRNENAPARIGFGDGQRGARLPRTQSPDRPSSASPAELDGEALSAARRELARLEDEFDDLEEQATELDRR